MGEKFLYTEGTGNSFFLYFDKNLPSSNFFKNKAKELSPDGFIFLDPLKPPVFNFLYSNKDGSFVDFCGNALRASAISCYEVFQMESVQLQTPVGKFEVKYSKNKKTACAEMPLPIRKEPVKIFGETIPLVSSGVPHLLFDTNKIDIEITDLEKLLGFSQRVRLLNLNGAEKYNLSYYDANSGPSPIPCITFERGVEGFTQSCGSGALSVANLFLTKENRKIRLKMPGGHLDVCQDLDKIFMEGPVTIIKIF